MHRTSDYGTVEAGKVADLVLIESDPTRSTSALHLSAVVLHGRLLDRAALDEQLHEVVKLADDS